MSGAGESLRRGGGGGDPVPRALLDLCREATCARDLRVLLRAPLHRWVPFDAYCINTCDPFTGVVSSSVGDGLSSRDALRLFAIESAGSDVNLLADVASSDAPAVLSQATGGEVQRSRRMREIFAPLGLRDELRAALPAGGRCWGFVHLFRSRGAFTERDTRRMASFATELGRALRRTATANAHGTRVGGSATAGPGIVVLARDGSAHVEAGGAPPTLRALDLDGHQPVPHGVYAAALQARHGRDERATTTVRAPRGGWVSIRGIRYGARPAAIVTEAERSRTAPLLLLAFDLSDREREVAARVLDGEANADIARTLGITLFTVKDHVKRVLAKTRTSGRAELLARVLGA
jgi:DNA-binding CsgD family transcriptional regulator